VEAANLYPSEALASLSLGHLFSMSINDLFIGIEQDVFQLRVQPGREGLYAGMSEHYCSRFWQRAGTGVKCSLS